MNGLNALEQEITRRAGAKDRVLDALRQAGLDGCTNVELCAPDVGGMRAIGRVHELRREGHDIYKQHEGGGVYRYRLRLKGSLVGYATTAQAVAQRGHPPLPPVRQVDRSPKPGRLF